MSRCLLSSARSALLPLTRPKHAWLIIGVYLAMVASMWAEKRRSLAACTANMGYRDRNCLWECSKGGVARRYSARETLPWRDLCAGSAEDVHLAASSDPFVLSCAQLLCRLPPFHPLLAYSSYLTSQVGSSRIHNSSIL